LPAGRRPAAVRTLSWLIIATAAAAVLVELLNWAYAEEAGFALTVRTCWALVRTLGFAVLLWHLRTGRAVAQPLGLILAVTTVFAVARLIVPRTGLPNWPGIAGFAVLGVLCGVLVWALYAWPPVVAHLSRRPLRRRVPGRLLTARVAAFAYAPLMLVPALVASARSSTANWGHCRSSWRGWCSRSRPATSCS
jgi:hypothetical protein